MKKLHFKNAYHIIMSAILAKANEIHSKTKLHTNDIEFVINKNMGTNNLENAYHIIMLTILATIDNNPDKIYYIGTLFGMKCFIDTTENSYSYQAYARYKKPNEIKYHIEDINFLDGMDDAIKRFFV